MDDKGYGRYIDEADGLPRWELPPSGHPPGLRWRYIREAVEELYPDFGGRFTAERLGIPSKYVNVMRYAAMFGIKVTRERKKKGYGEMASKLVRIYKMERARVMGGLPQVTGVNVGKHCGPVQQKFYGIRNRLVKVYGYYYCIGDSSVLLYDDKTRRRLPDSTAPNGFTEEMLTQRYGITFEPVDGLDI